MEYEKLGVLYLGQQYDLARGQPRSELLLYDSKDLTTHAVCVGMTGSGKTGLCLAMLEEAAIDGIPAICIDPKGDIANLMLSFPNLAPADFRPWVDPQDAARKGLTVDTLAAQTADLWAKGLADTGQSPERIVKFKNAACVSIYTPGSNAGLPISVLKSFAPPQAAAGVDPAAMKERVTAVVSGVLGLIGIEADPLKSREHILLASILGDAWSKERALDIAGMITAIQKPPFDKVGVFDLESFFSAKDRLAFAMQLNNLLAAPGFSSWMTGESLDIQRLLYGGGNKPRIAILSIAHLSDAERMFFVTLLLNELISWMRTQTGTTSLRAIFYMDEIFGYFPPSAMPPSKTPMLTLLKQARAFGLGCVLATQNPVDLDYKGLANAGTWFIGRLQTERDKARVIEGLQSALGGSVSLDAAGLDRQISALGNRLFLMRNVHEDQPVAFKTRWALSYLRGPVTSAEIQTLMADQKAATAAAAPNISAAVAAAATSAGARPAVAGDVTEWYFRPTATGAVTYRAQVLGLAKAHFVDAKNGIDLWNEWAYLAPASEQGSDTLWSEAKSLTDYQHALDTGPQSGAAFAELPSPLLRGASYAQFATQLAEHLYQNVKLSVLVCDALKQCSQPNETETAFRARLALALRETRDAAIETLRQQYAPRVQALQDQIHRAGERVDREKSQLTQQKVQTAISVGATVLGALFGRKLASATNIGRAATAMNRAGRIGRESGDVDRAEDDAEALGQRLKDLQAECEATIGKLGASLDASTVACRTVEVAPRKSDILIGKVGLAWCPWVVGADGFPAPAFKV
jgi:hypothetical protein